MMFNWLKRLAQPFTSLPAQKADNRSSKEYLNDLRENELSVGAAMRRGEKVNTAPVQISSNAPTVPQPNRRSELLAMSKAGEGLDTESANAEDIGLSLAVGAATGSAAIGYVVGGSIAGALAGQALAESTN